MLREPGASMKPIVRGSNAWSKSSSRPLTSTETAGRPNGSALFRNSPVPWYREPAPRRHSWLPVGEADAHGWKGMSGDAPKTFLWSLQGLVALVFTLVVLAISAALIGYNHTQLTTLTFQDAEEDFQRITNNIRGELSGSLRVAGSVLDTASLTVDGDLPLEDLAKVLTSVLENLDQVLPAAMGIFIGRADGTHVVVQSLDESRPPGNRHRSSRICCLRIHAGREFRKGADRPLDRDRSERPRTAPDPTAADDFRSAQAALVRAGPRRNRHDPHATLSVRQCAGGRHHVGARIEADVGSGVRNRYDSGEPGPIPGQAAVSGRSGVAGIRFVRSSHRASARGFVA